MLGTRDGGAATHPIRLDEHPTFPFPAWAGYAVGRDRSGPPGGTPRAGTQPRLIDLFDGVVEAWLRADVTLKGSVIHGRAANGGAKPGTDESMPPHNSGIMR